jgi:hypothetical protein
MRLSVGHDNKGDTAMEINKAKFERVVEEAKAKAAGNKRWIAAIEKAPDAIINNKWVIIELRHCLVITTESGKTYRSNGVCQCEAFFRDQPCKHRAAARLLDLYNEAEAADEAAPSRSEIIADIEKIWRAKFPTVNLADELMARFRRNKLEMLSIDFLMAVRAAIA